MYVRDKQLLKSRDLGLYLLSQSGPAGDHGRSLNNGLFQIVGVHPCGGSDLHFVPKILRKFAKSSSILINFPDFIP